MNKLEIEPMADNAKLFPITPHFGSSVMLIFMGNTLNAIHMTVQVQSANSCDSEYFSENIKIYLYCSWFLDTHTTQFVEIFTCWRQGHMHPFILYIQHHGRDGSWWSGDARSQGMNSNCIDLVVQKYFSFRTRCVKCPQCMWHTSASLRIS